MKSNLNKEKIFLLVILINGLFLRLFKLKDLMVFNGDVAWDYLSARDLVLERKIPLVGIASSVPWLHQGALFTYFLAFTLYLGKFNPLVPAYFVSIINVISIYLIYLIGKKWFSEKVGLFSALFYATSPLIVSFDRYPYHQTFISLLTLTFFFYLSKIKENPKYLILCYFIFGILMQLELSNIVLLPVIVIFTYEIRKKITFQRLLVSFLVFCFPWTPKIIFDLKNNFTQTLGFIAWIIHKFPIVRNFIGESNTILNPVQRTFKLFQFISKIISPNRLFSITIIFFSFVIFLINFQKSRRKSFPEKILFSWIFIPILGFWLMGSPSESYIPVIYGAITLVFVLSLSFYIKKSALQTLIFFICLFNVFFIFKNNFFVSDKNKINSSGFIDFGQSYQLYLEMANFVVKDSASIGYNLIPLGSFSKFSSSILSLEYLTWYLGNPPSKEKEKTLYFVYNKADNLTIKKQIFTKDFPYFQIAKVIR